MKFPPLSVRVREFGKRVDSRQRLPRTDLSQVLLRRSLFDTATALRSLSLSVVLAMNSPRYLLSQPKNQLVTMRPTLQSIRQMHLQSNRQYSTLQSLLFTPSSFPKTLTSSAAKATWRRLFLPPTSSTSLLTIMQQNRSLSYNPPGGSGSGMNLGNIFNNQGANRKSGETLEQYGVDLTKLAKENKLDPVIGRHEEIRRTLQILGKGFLSVSLS